MTRETKLDSRRDSEDITYSSLVNFALSFRSAPAQNAASELLARTSARVGPLPPSALMASTWSPRLFRSCRDSAFRASGLFNKRTLICPVPGAGISRTLITEP